VQVGQDINPASTASKWMSHMFHAPSKPGDPSTEDILMAAFTSELCSDAERNRRND
jgi:hypothetical protein